MTWDSRRTEQVTVAVGMSGGVDSAVAAALLADAGWKVIGLTAIMTRERSRCCSDESVGTAREVCAQLGIRHELVDVHDVFESRIIGSFISEYLAGRTPSPCALCNPLIKFGLLMDRAEQLGAGCVATGHYARVVHAADGTAHLLRGVDARKDQSYFLALLSQDQLRRSLFPLGGMTKREVSRIAADKNLAAHKSKESQEVCFVPDGDHGSWIDVRSLDTRGPGDIVNARGEKIGTHRGIHRYTVGQRRGVGVATGSPVYVCGIDAAANRVIVGSRDAALSSGMTLGEVRWISGRAPGVEFESACQIRFNHAPAPCAVALSQDGRAQVRFAEPQFAVAPGQLAAFCSDDEVLGAGWIEAAGR